jgi:hypothetical protein
MLKIWVDKNIRKIIIETDDLNIKKLLETTASEIQYLPWVKKWGTIKKTTKLYENRVKANKNGIYTFILGLGWAGYLINVLRNYISKQEYDDILLNAIYSDEIRTVPFEKLRDYQNQDCLHLLKYRVGLFCCYVGYGKTSVIATLADYFYKQGKKVLIVTPGKKANEEIVKRLKTWFDLDIPSSDGRLVNMITNGLMIRKDIKDPSKLAKLEAEWATFDVLLVDEVEYTINDSGMFLFNRLTGLSRCYGFSGSADKTNASVISFINGLDETVIRNKDLISFFGPSLVYRMPIVMDIDMIKIQTDSLSKVRFDSDDLAGNTYLNIMTKIWTTPEVCKTVVRVAKKFPMMFIPINNLVNIISTWIDNYFIGTFRILLICADGYIYYDLNGNKTKLKDLSEACKYVSSGLVDIIPSTSAGFRALDLPGLENIFLVSGKVAGVTIQSVGRVSRGNHMNIISLDTSNGKKIPIYSKGMLERNKMIMDYYKYCNINEKVIDEINLMI